MLTYVGAFSVRDGLSVRPTWLNSGSTFALGLLLFFPFVYYPVTTMIWLVAPDLAGVYKQALAGGAASLTVSFLLLGVLAERHGLPQRLSWSVVSRAPQTWGFAFLAWLIVLTTFQREPTSVQNLIVYTVFFFAISLAQFVQDSLLITFRVWVWLFAGVLTTLGLIEAFGGSFPLPISWSTGGLRLYASYCLLAVVGLFAVSSPAWVRLLLGLGLFGGAVASESRAAFGAIAVVLIVGFVVTANKPIRAFLVTGPLFGLALGLALQLPSIQRRMWQNSNSGFFINDSGRIRVWQTTGESWFARPLLGKGAGSSQTLAAQPPSKLEHAHSEYLRILHDAGLIGFVLFGAFVVLALLWLWPRANGRPRSELVVAGFLVVVAGLVLGTIENYLVFPSLMWPAAVFLGLGLAAARRDGQSVLDPRRKVRAASSENTVLPHR